VTAARLALDCLRRADGQPERVGPSALTPAQMLHAPYWLVRLRHPRQPALIHDQLLDERRDDLRIWLHLAVDVIYQGRAAA
jgi:hypothetical protein